MKSCTNCRGNLADFVTICPYCGVPQPVPQIQMTPGGWETSQTSNKAIASLVCGVLLCFGPFANIPAIILGHLSLLDIKRSGERMAGKGMAIAGLVLGYIGIALSATYIIFIAVVVRRQTATMIPMNETVAVSTMRTYGKALKTYAEKCPQQGFPATLIPLGPGAGDCKHANLVDLRMAASLPVRGGYRFKYSTGVSGPEKVTAFALVARPVTPGLSGTRYFYLDESGIIRESANQNIGPNSKPLAESQDSVDADKDEVDDDAPESAAEPDAEQLKALSANEAAAISSVRMYSAALGKYAKKCPLQVYPATLSPLGPGAGNCEHANLVDSRMAADLPTRDGYKFQYSTGATGTGRVIAFSLVARPVAPGVSGKRYFYLDETGVIRGSPNQNIGPNSEPLGKN